MGFNSGFKWLNTTYVSLQYIVCHFRFYIGKNSADISTNVFVGGGHIPTFKYMNLILICVMTE